MFFHMPEASKACLAKLVSIASKYNFHFIDCQVHTPHLEKLGAVEVDRTIFLEKLQESLAGKPKDLNWQAIQ